MVGAVHDTHRGLAKTVLLRCVLDFNRDEVDTESGRLAAWLGLEGGFAGLTDFVLGCAATSACRIRSTGSA